MKTNRFFTKLLAVMMTLALCSGMVLPALAATVEAKLECKIEEHTHTEDCYNGETVEEKVLVCGKTEETVEGHVHSAECYSGNYELTCTDPTHMRETDSHTDACYETYKLFVCTLDEHTHSSACQKTCDLAEHSHDENCGEECTTEEHSHSDACQSSCDLEAHQHGGDCYTQERKLACSDPSHSLPTEQHTDACYQHVLTCDLEESTETHQHTDACYETSEVKELSCGKEEHSHSEACYETARRATLKLL